MGLPAISQTIADGGLGIIEGDADATVVVGHSSLGTTNTIYAFGGTDTKVVTDTLGAGKGPEAVAYELGIAAGPVYFVKCATSTAGTNSVVGHTGTGTATITLAGAPYDDYSAIIEITTAGTNLAAATATFRYSLDGGDTYSSEYAVPTGGTYVIAGTNITATFVDGTFVKGDLYTWTSTAPAFNTSDLNSALDALFADATLQYGLVHIVGQASSGSASATIAGAVSTKLAAAETNFRYTFAVMEAADDTDANLKTAFLSFADSRVMVAAGMAEITSPITGRVVKRSAAWPIVGRLRATPLKEHPGRVRRGSLPGVGTLYRDEFKTPGLDAARFATLRTWNGRQGKYVTRGRMMAPTGSDFSSVQNRRVMDRACAISYDAMLELVNDDFDVNRVTGFIAEADARRFESEVNAKLKAALVDSGQVVSVRVIIKRDNNVLSTGKVYYKVRIIPKAYAEYIDNDIGFTNPAIELIAA